MVGQSNFVLKQFTKDINFDVTKDILIENLGITFTIKPIYPAENARLQMMRISSTTKEKDIFSTGLFDELQSIVKSHIVGWSNIVGRDGSPVEFTPKNLDFFFDLYSLKLCKSGEEETGLVSLLFHFMIDIDSFYGSTENLENTSQPV